MEIQLRNVVLLSTLIALIYVAHERCYELPCKVNKSFKDFMNLPLTVLLGHAAAADGLCKKEHFCCVELKSDSNLQDICDACSQWKVQGFAGIILVNFKDDVSLSEASWMIAQAHKETVVVVPRRLGVTLLRIFGSDMAIAPPTLTRFVYVKIFPKKSGMCHQNIHFVVS